MNVAFKRANYCQHKNFSLQLFESNPCLPHLSSRSNPSFQTSCFDVFGYILICVTLLLSEVTALLITETQAEVRDILQEDEESFHRSFATSTDSMQLAQDILLRLSVNDAAREKQFKNAKLDARSFYELLHAVKEEIRPLKSIIVTPLQSKTFPQASKLPFAFNLPTPALTLLTVRV